MFAVRRIAQVAPGACRLAVQQRGFLSGPPRVRISFPEKVAHGVAIAIGVCVTPLWIMSHLKEYRGDTEEVAED